METMSCIAELGNKNEHNAYLNKNISYMKKHTFSKEKVHNKCTINIKSTVVVWEQCIIQEVVDINIKIKCYIFDWNTLQYHKSDTASQSNNIKMNVVTKYTILSDPGYVADRKYLWHLGYPQTAVAQGYSMSFLDIFLKSYFTVLQFTCENGL